MKNSSGILIGAVVLVIIVVGAFYLWGGSSSTWPTGGGTEASTTGISGNGYGHSGVKPAVQTSGYASVSSTSAVVVGQIIPGPDGAQYWFQYGPTTDFGSSTPITNAAASQNIIGAGGYLQNLKPNTEYYFRIAAKNDGGTIYGGPYKFITAAK